CHKRDMKVVVLGTLSPEIPCHVAVRDAANASVVLPRAIYDQAAVKALRFHARAYLHGHTVGGTNPSLVEALAAGNMVIAHDNPYNRWTAGAAAIYFTDARS
ncbi:glycosyl transferase, partial [Mesorhizobium sp. M00.F.Ca.ET.158.01.1.1]